MNPRRHSRNLLLSLIPLWAGCVQAPSKVAFVDQSGWTAPALPGRASTPADSTARGSRARVDEKIGQARVFRPDRPDVAGPTSDISNDAESAGKPTTTSGHQLTLEDAKSLALRLNPILGQSFAAVETAAGNEEIAYSAFLPTVQGSYGYQGFSSQTGFSGTAPSGRFPLLPVRGFGPGSQEFSVTEIQMRWTIFQFGRQVAKHDQSVLREEITRLQADRAWQSVEFDVSQAYFRALEARSSLVIAEEGLARAEAVLRDARNQERRGVLTPEDVLRAEVQVAEVRQILTRAKSAVRVTIAGLNRAIGLDVSAPTEVADRRQQPFVKLTLEDSLGLALVNRREIEVVRKGIADANLGVKIAKTDYLPTISIQSAASDITGTAVQNGRVLAGGLFATQDLFTGGKRRGQVRAAEAAVRRAAAQAKQIVDGVAYEVHYAHTAVDDARESVAQARTTVAQARENLRLVDNRYKTGDAQPTDVIDAHTAQTRAEQELNTALYEYQTAVARLEFAVGAPIAAPATAPEALAVPPATTAPSPFARQETPGRSRSARPSPLEIPTLPPALRGSDTFPELAPPTPFPPATPRPSPLGETPSGSQGLAVPPYIPQPPGRLP
jgi:outer membrane protein